MPRILLVFMAIGAAAGTAGARRCPAEPADTIYHNGTVETLDARFTRGEAIALHHGRVLAVGSSAAIVKRFRGCGTRVVDLGGRTILPGFVAAPAQASAWTFGTRPPPDSEAEALDWLRTTQEAQLSVGITTQAEALVPPGLVDRLRALAAAGDLHIRTTLYLRRTGNCID